MLYIDYRRIEGNEDYIISNYGDVISLKRKTSIILKTCLDEKGYKMVNIRPTTRVHILVGNAFVGKRENGLTFDHIDRDNTNNRADNIRLATKSEQAENTKMNARRSLTLPQSFKLNPKFFHVYNCIPRAICFAVGQVTYK